MNDSHSPLTPEDKPSGGALALSALVHLLLIGALFFGVQWKSQSPSSVAVEVWRGAPAPVAVAKPEPTPEPPPPPPETKPEPKPLPKVEPTPPVKPDITVKDDKKKKEEPKKQEPKKEDSKKPEPRKEEPKREVPDFQKQLEQELKDAQRQKAAAQAAQQQRASADAELRQLGQARANQAAEANARARADYIAKISRKVRDKTSTQGISIQGNPQVIFEVTQLPTGDVLTVKLRKSSGNRRFDEAVEAGILKSSPLPLPDQPGVFDRELVLKYNHSDE